MQIVTFKYCFLKKLFATNNIRFYLKFFFIVLYFLNCNTVNGKKIHNTQYKFTINFPSSMVVNNYIIDTTRGEVFYDTLNNIVLLISGQESKFKSVDEYLNCSRQELSQDLINWSGDTSLQLLSCYKNEDATILNFTVSTSITGYNGNFIYFIHNRKSDIQFSFFYKLEFAKESKKYIEQVMNTLKLK